jgi:hypothetical protein
MTYDSPHWDWGKGYCKLHLGQPLPCQRCIDTEQMDLIHIVNLDKNGIRLTTIKPHEEPSILQDVHPGIHPTYETKYKLKKIYLPEDDITEEPSEFQKVIKNISWTDIINPYMETLRRQRSNTGIFTMTAKDIIRHFVGNAGAIKATELVTKCITHVHEAKINVGTVDWVKTIAEMVKEGDLVEQEYVLPDSTHRNRSLIFPKGTFIR